ncbi:hypothetical protein Clacol_006030 [Clathrus columnatus]|uniref:Acid phosphatase n=1 Tax=Clathrus columnatus TaxID=1419009 RepID=A0AAV5AAY1_9AGAM|nr:hypothetical protein Clacol_006030 [Clathrus columnatus]
MFSLRTAVLLLASLRVAFAAQSVAFVPPSTSPTKPSPNYVGQSNFTLPRPIIQHGIVFDQMIVVNLENTDFSVAASSPVFQQLARQGITYTNSHGLAHPSEPNYMGQGGASTFGLFSDDFEDIPANVSSVVDLLEEKHISWASYQENMPCNGYNGKTFASFNYLTGSGTDNFYARKHNQLAMYNSTKLNPRRAGLMRNYNDFANDLNAAALPQYIFMTPNIVNDAHDTDINFASAYLEYFLIPLLDNPKFNGPRTLILLTFDEDETGPENNLIFTLALGNAVPKKLHGTTDNTYLTHYTVLTTPQVNWGLNCLGRQDTNKTMANVLGFVAEATGYKNLVVKNPPTTNDTVAIPGPFSPIASFVTPWEGPDIHAKCANPKGHVYVNNNPPVNPDLYNNGQCPQVAFSSNPLLEWNTEFDAQIIAEQRKFHASSFDFEPFERIW